MLSCAKEPQFAYLLKADTFTNVSSIIGGLLQIERKVKGFSSSLHSFCPSPPLPSSSTKDSVMRWIGQGFDMEVLRAILTFAMCLRLSYINADVYFLIPKIK